MLKNLKNTLRTKILNSVKSKENFKRIKLCMVAHIYNLSYSGSKRQEDFQSKVNPGKASETLSPRKNTNERAGGIAQMAECFPNIGKTPPPALSFAIKAANWNNWTAAEKKKE
jgi:hypothetical protein